MLLHGSDIPEGLTCRASAPTTRVPVCLEAWDVPSEADLRAAHVAVPSQSTLRFHGVGIAGSDPWLHVEVVVAYRATVDATFEAAPSRLASKRISITDAVQPLQSQGRPTAQTSRRSSNQIALQQR